MMKQIILTDKFNLQMLDTTTVSQLSITPINKEWLSKKLNEHGFFSAVDSAEVADMLTEIFEVDVPVTKVDVNLDANTLLIMVQPYIDKDAGCLQFEFLSIELCKSGNSYTDEPLTVNVMKAFQSTEYTRIDCKVLKAVLAKILPPAVVDKMTIEECLETCKRIYCFN